MSLLRALSPLAAWASSAAPQRFVAAAFSTTAVEAAKAKIPPETLNDVPLTVAGGQAFGDDLRGTSGLSLYDGIKNHTDKWLQVSTCGSTSRVWAESSAAQQQEGGAPQAR